MADDVSVMMRFAIVLMMTAALLGSVLNVSIPASKFLVGTSDKFTKLAEYPYRSLQSVNGRELNSARIYRMIEEGYSYVSIVAVRDVDAVPMYDLVICKQNNTMTPDIESLVSSYGSYDDDSTGYVKLNTKFAHDYINEDFVVTVNMLRDGSLEVICDKSIK